MFGLMPAIFTSTRYAKRSRPDFIPMQRPVYSIHNTVIPLILNFWLICYPQRTSSDSILQLFFRSGKQEKFNCSSVSEFCSFCYTGSSKQKVAFTTFDRVKMYAQVSLMQTSSVAVKKITRRNETNLRT